MTNPRIVIADPHRLFRDGLAAILAEAGIPVIAAGDSLAEIAPTLTGEHAADVIVFDFSDDAADGEAARAVRRDHPQTKLVAMSNDTAPPRLALASALGLDGFIPKTMSVTALIHTLHLIAAGTRFFPVAASPAGTANGVHPIHRPHTLTALSERERAVLEGLGAGLSNKHIAARLTIAEPTVKVHVKSIMRKLGAANRTQAVIFARRAAIA